MIELGISAILAPPLGCMRAFLSKTAVSVLVPQGFVFVNCKVSNQPAEIPHQPITNTCQQNGLRLFISGPILMQCIYVDMIVVETPGPEREWHRLHADNKTLEK